MTPMFQAYERETFGPVSKWIPRTSLETREQTTDRLVLHGLRCGKRTLHELGYHAGLSTHRNNKAITGALERLVAAGLARKAVRGWEAV